MECRDPELVPYIESLYGGFRAASGDAGARFRLERSPDGRRWRCESPSGAFAEWRDPVEALAWLDDELTIGVQHRRPDLLFVHAAAIARDERAVLLVAESGGGKSTTTWAAVHHGFALLSDEVAPVDPASLLVHPYPRAICLKASPPRPYDLPPGSRHASGAHFVATRLLPMPPSPARPLALIAFVSYRPQDPRPSLRAVGAAESAARLYANSLNVLAHGGEGLDAVTSLSEQVPSFLLHSGDLPATCALVADALGRSAPRTSPATLRVRGG